MTSADPSARKVTTQTLRRMKVEGQRIVALTAYDFLFGALLDASGVDVVLVGDSVATVVQGEETTVPVTVDEMVYHSRMVARGVRRALVVGDMPFLSYQVSDEDALRNAGRFMKEARVEAVKLEGGRSMQGRVRCLTDAGIPVMGHLGLMPQSIHSYGSYRVRGEGEEAEAIIDDALALQDAGAFAIVLEKVPATLATDVTARLSIPTIGIGAGAGCDGQILVSYDMLGLFDRFRPRFARRYRELATEIREAVREYAADVRERRFPTEDESY